MFADVVPEFGLAIDPETVTHVPFSLGFYLGIVVGIVIAVLLAGLAALLLGRIVEMVSRKRHVGDKRPLPH